MIIIFGHTGFIGNVLYRHFLTSGEDCAGAATAQCNLLDPAALQAFMARVPRPYTVINCAVLNRRHCTGNDGLEQNLAMVQNIVTAIAPQACRAFIQLSSADVYGQLPSLPINENSPVHPASYYARAKLAGEEVSTTLQDKGVPVITLRLPGVYGPGDQGHSLIGKFFRQTRAGEKITLTGCGEVLRDYLFVDDLCRLVAALVAEPRQTLLNVATGRSWPLKEILAMIREHSSLCSEVTFSASMSATASDLVFDTQRLRGHFPNLALTNLPTGIAKYAEALSKVADDGPSLP